MRLPIATSIAKVANNHRHVEVAAQGTAASTHISLDNSAISPQPLPLHAYAFSLPRTSEVRTPKAAIAAQAIKAAWKLVANVCCRALISVGDNAELEMSARPAAAPPKPAKMAPAIATLMLWPTTRPAARKPDALPC